ncbi:MAG: hypothetical protein V4557_12550 [Bacteroidota bacterium]
MTIGDIRNSLMPLIEDAAEAENELSKNEDSQFARRTYIRSIFSCLEGTIWILKDVCFNAKPQTGVRKMSVAEYTMLKEISFELKNNGDVKSAVKFLRLPDNLKFTFKMLNKLFKCNIDLEIGKKNWTNFIETLEIRNRITHPKDSTSFTITDSEIAQCKETSGWFNELTHKCFQAFMTNPTS